MSAVLTSPTNNGNGSKPQVQTTDWLKQTVQQFFSSFNWDDRPPEVQEMRAAFQADDSEPLSLKLTVSQFFGAINWEGTRCFTDTARVAPPVDTELNADLTFMEDMSAIDGSPDDDGFTLDDFSGLF
jgi:hypothetical protein